MHHVISYALTTAFVLMVLFTVARTLMVTYGDTTESLATIQERVKEQNDIRIAGPIGLSVSPSSPVPFTLSNIGEIPISDFSDWNVIFEVGQTSGFGIAYLDYTTDANPAANEWTVSGIYMDAANLTAEVVDLGILNPGEEMIIVANPSPALTGNTDNRVTFVTPSGHSIKVIFEAKAFFSVVDEGDIAVYFYDSSGNYLGLDALDAGNNSANGITSDSTNFWTTNYGQNEAYKYTSRLSVDSQWNVTANNTDAIGTTTDGTNIWIVDDNDDIAYKYDMSGTYVTEWSLDAANADPTGITTDDTNIWVVDTVDAKAYKYDMSGTIVSNFSLNGSNTDPTGITTDGTNIWVVDVVDDKIYKYDMSGNYDSDFDLTGINSDPQGITLGNK